MNTPYADLFSSVSGPSAETSQPLSSRFLKSTDISPSEDFVAKCGGGHFSTILADPPWQFQNRTGKVAPEHHRLSRYPTMTLEDIKALPVSMAAAATVATSESPV